METAKKVLELQDDPCAVLSLMADGVVVAIDTPLPTVRRAYMRLAAVIHPDKLSGFDRATEAFQVVVRCFDAFANGDVKPKKGTSKAAAAPVKKTPKAAKPEAAAAAAEAKDSTAVVAATSKTAEKRPKRARKEQESSSSDSDSDDEQTTLPRLQNFAPKKPRSNDNCKVTPMSCPRCATPWQPDTPKLYTLVMAYNTKVHCETCLLHYGWATAQHHCPFCKRGVDYDPHSYNSTVTCPHASCKKSFGYMHFPIDDKVLLEMARKRAAEAAEEAARKEREERMSRRGGNSKEDDLDIKVGQCMVEDKCPHCLKAVRSKHRQHVVQCIASGPAKVAPVRRVVIEGETKAAKKPKAKSSASKPKSAGKKALSTKKMTTPKAKPAKKKAAPKKRRGSDSDESDDSDDDYTSDSDTDDSD